MNHLLTSIQSLTTKILTRALPDRTKRLVLLSSLYAWLCNTTQFDDKTINKLNKIMELSSQDSALKFPMQLSSVIWHGDGNSTQLYPAPQLDEETMINQILARVPKWLKYSDDRSVSQDIIKLLANRITLGP